MSTTVIPKLEPSERPASPILFPLGQQRPLDRGSREKDMEEASSFDVSQSGIPDEDESGFLLNLSMHSNSWSPQSPASAMANLDVVNVTSGTEDTSGMSVSGHSESRSAVDLSFRSGDSENLAIGAQNDGHNAMCSDSIEQEQASLENNDPRLHRLEKNVHRAVCSRDNGQSTVSIENNDHIPVTSDNIDHSSGCSDSNGYGPTAPVSLENKEYITPPPVNLEKKEHRPTALKMADCRTVDCNDTRSVTPEASCLENKEYKPTAREINGCRLVECSDTRPHRDGENGSDIPKYINCSIVSVKSESIMDDYDNMNLENSSYEPGNCDLNDAAGNPADHSAIDLSTSGEATVDMNVSEVSVTDDDVNVTSTTQEMEVNNRVPPPPPPEQEVVDVESDQPCVVDLTCEDDDDVDVVAVVEPVIFIGTGQGREPRRRDRGNNASPVVEDLTDSGSLQEPVNRINDETNNNIAGAEGGGHHEIWHQDIDLQNPNLTFGSLLEQAPIETVDDNQLQPQPPRLRRHRPQRELRSSRRRRRSGSRSRSPNLFPDMELVDEHNDIADLDFMNDLEGIMNGGNVWFPPPNQLPLDVNRRVEEEHHQRVARIAAPRPPPSPPPVEQPTISCLVCLDSVATIHSSSRTLCSTTCGHVFCSACIEEVVRQRKQCPVCRKRLTKKQYHPLFI